MSGVRGGAPSHSLSPPRQQLGVSGLFLQVFGEVAGVVDGLVEGVLEGGEGVGFEGLGVGGEGLPVHAELDDGGGFGIIGGWGDEGVDDVAGEEGVVDEFVADFALVFVDGDAFAEGDALEDDFADGVFFGIFEEGAGIDAAHVAGGVFDAVEENRPDGLEVGVDGDEVVDFGHAVFLFTLGGVCSMRSHYRTLGMVELQRSSLVDFNATPG